MSRLQVTAIFWGSEWGYLDNIKRLVFWLWNIKQLNFSHFNPNSENFALSSGNFFFQNEIRAVPKKPILFCLVYQGAFSHCPTILDYLRRCPKTNEDSPRLLKDSKVPPKTVEDVQRQPKISEKKSRKFFKSRTRIDAKRLLVFVFYENPPHSTH